jgi:hypothetical protein
LAAAYTRTATRTEKAEWMKEWINERKKNLKESEEIK